MNLCSQELIERYQKMLNMILYNMLINQPYLYLYFYLSMEKGLMLMSFLTRWLKLRY